MTKRIRRLIAITAKVADSHKGSDLKGFRLVPSILSPSEDALMTFLVPFPVSSSGVSIGGETLPKVSVRSSESCDSACGKNNEVKMNVKWLKQIEGQD